MANALLTGDKRTAFEYINKAELEECGWNRQTFNHLFDTLIAPHSANVDSFFIVVQGSDVSSGYLDVHVTDRDGKMWNFSFTVYLSPIPGTRERYIETTLVANILAMASNRKVAEDGQEMTAANGWMARGTVLEKYLESYNQAFPANKQPSYYFNDPHTRLAGECIEFQTQLDRIPAIVERL